MAVPTKETARRVEELSAALRAAGLRLTHQRLEVVREIAGTDEHPDVEAIYRGVRRRAPTISLDTVYRTLGTLADRGLLLRVDTPGGPARYDANLARHHHFVCIRCGLIRDVEDARLDAWGRAAEVRMPGTLVSVEVRFKGICARCRASGSGPGRGRSNERGSRGSQPKEHHR